jgi:hypothetical protein
MPRALPVVPYSRKDLVRGLAEIIIYKVDFLIFFLKLSTIEVANAQDLAHALRTQRKFSNVRVAKHLQQKNSIHKKKAHLRMRPCAAHILNTKSDHEFP